MQTQPIAGPNLPLTQVVAGVAQALSMRADDSAAGHAGRVQLAADTIMDFAPRDSVEAMLAGHCVMFHHLIVEDVEASRRGGTDRVTRAGIVAMDRAFGANFTRLARYRRERAAAARREAAEQEAGQEEAGQSGADRGEESRKENARSREGWAETAIADRVRRHQSDASVAISADGAAPAGQAATDNAQTATAETARGAADAARSIPPAVPDQPNEAWLASAATQLAGLNRQARREFGRQARKRMSAMAAGSGHTVVPAPRAERASTSGSG